MSKGRDIDDVEVSVIRGMGGNGSTFLSRVLAAMPGTVLLSECNPRSANLFEYRLNPLKQLEQKHAALASKLSAYDYNELGSSALFGRFLNDLVAALPSSDRLIIRDYNLADFVSSPFAWAGAPRSSLNAALGSRPRKEIVLVREPIDQYLSLKSHRALKRALTFKAFLRGTSRMLDAFGAAPIIRYESLFTNFDSGLLAICEHLGVRWNASWSSRLSAATDSDPMVSGNARGRSTLSASSPAFKSGEHDRLNRECEGDELLATVRKRTGYTA